ncbi:MAG: hypothetical protein MPN21_06125 [Thermoanaerobaculia bacterium]|nr:hypothetical protein [Thermoanaerobaculia bacterium]
MTDAPSPRTRTPQSRHLPHGKEYLPLGPALRRIVFFLLIALPATGQPVSQGLSQDGLSEEERVTAIDVLLSFERSDAADWARSRQSPSGLEADDFTVVVDGQERSVVSVQALEDAAETASWAQLIYVDCRMASRAHTTWTLAALADRAEALVKRGTVEVVVADPAPTTVLAASDDAELVRAVLGRLTGTQDCADLLTLLRDEAQTKIKATASDARAATAREALQAERNLIRSSRLALATRLTDGLRREGGAQKALFLVHQGHAAPEDFYGPYLKEKLETSSDTLGDDALSRIVASYGWTVVALETREETETSGVYIGDWFFFPASGGDNPEKTTLEIHMELPTSGGQNVDDGDPWQSFLGGIRGKLRENKDVGKAESYLELGNALLGQEKYERAADSFEKALYHFADATKTRGQQTIAMVQLGNALAAAGKNERARRAIEAALNRDPELAERSGAGSVKLGDRGHGGLIDATAGIVVRTAAGLDRAVTRLHGKTRLTFQIAGEPRGEALPLEVRFGGRVAIAHPAWTRSSTPREVSEARLLRLVDDELRDGTADDGEIDLAAARTEDGSIDLAAALQGAGLESPQLRLSTAAGTAIDGLMGPIEQRPLDSGAALPIEVPQDAEFVAVLVEDLDTGAWGAGLFGG